MAQTGGTTATLASRHSGIPLGRLHMLMKPGNALAHS